MKMSPTAQKKFKSNIFSLKNAKYKFSPKKENIIIPNDIKVGDIFKISPNGEFVRQ